MRSVIKYGVAVLLSYTLISPCFAADEISVTPLLVEMISGKSMRKDIQVTNRGKNVSYVQITTFRVENPGTPSEKEVQVTNPQELGLLVTPQKFALNPSAIRTIRLAVLKPAVNEDHVYRLYVRPIPTKLVNEAIIPEGDQKVAIGLRVTVSYGVLALVRPANPQGAISLTRTGRQLIAKNTGNTVVALTDGTQCPDDPKQCKKIESKRVYAGKTWTTELPEAKPVRFTASFAGKYLTVTSN